MQTISKTNSRNNLNRVTPSEKVLIHQLFSEGMKPMQIAKKIGRDQKQIRRELFKPVTNEGIFNVLEKQNWLL